MVDPVVFVVSWIFCGLAACCSLSSVWRKARLPASHLVVAWVMAVAWGPMSIASAWFLLAYASAGREADDARAASRAHLDAVATASTTIRDVAQVAAPSPDGE